MKNTQGKKKMCFYVSFLMITLLVSGGFALYVYGFLVSMFYILRGKMNQKILDILMIYADFLTLDMFGVTFFATKIKENIDFFHLNIMQDKILFLTIILILLTSVSFFTGNTVSFLVIKKIFIGYVANILIFREKKRYV